MANEVAAALARLLAQKPSNRGLVAYPGPYIVHVDYYAGAFNFVTCNECELNLRCLTDYNVRAYEARIKGLMCFTSRISFYYRHGCDLVFTPAEYKIKRRNSYDLEEQLGQAWIVPYVQRLQIYFEALRHNFPALSVRLTDDRMESLISTLRTQKCKEVTL